MISKKNVIVFLLGVILTGIFLKGYADTSPDMGCTSTNNGSPSLGMGGCVTATQLAAGTAAQRPSSPIPGMLRYGIDTLAAEMYTSSGVWAIFYTSKSFNNAPSHTIQTVAAAGNGWQISAGRDSQVSYSVLINVTASIVSGQSGYIVLEIAPTNSSLAADWVEVGRVSASQVYTLAIALQGVQGSGAPMTTIVPAGYYVRLRSVNVTGTPTYSFVSGQEVQL